MKLNLSNLHPLLDRETEDIPVILVTLIYKNGGSAPVELYFSTDNEDEFVIDGQQVRGTLSQGRQYLFCPMRVTLPTDN
jgi:hypothetical protein